MAPRSGAIPASAIITAGALAPIIDALHNWMIAEGSMGLKDVDNHQGLGLELHALEKKRVLSPSTEPFLFSDIALQTCRIFDYDLSIIGVD